MAIPVLCTTCQKTLSAPDQYAGKKVKCPKCGQALSVPGQPAAVASGTPGKPVASRAAPAAPKAAPAPRTPAPQLPLQTFEELKVPSRLRKSIEKEIGEEKIVWMGRPTPESLLFKAKIGMVVGVILTALIIGGTVVGLQQATDQMIRWVILGISAMVLLTMGLPLATMPIWVKMLINYRDCYVLTAKRAIVFDNEKILSATVKSFNPEELTERELWVGKKGDGSITFRTETVDLGTRTTRKKRTQETADGGKVEITTITTKELKAPKGVGFLDIDNVEGVEAMLRHLFKLGPPAKKNVAA